MPYSHLLFSAGGSSTSVRYKDFFYRLLLKLVHLGGASSDSGDLHSCLKCLFLPY